jgi:hypothetical protein
MDYPIRAREGNVYITPENKEVKISNTIAKLSSPQTQKEALEDIGINLTNKTLIIKFMEIGNPYAEPLGDRTKISDKLTTTFEIELSLDNPAPQPLDSIGKKLRDINDKYHGRGDILNYAVECTKNSQMPSYLEYMKEHYPEEKRSPLFKSILETGKPNEAYFQKVSEKMTPEELAENQQ